jgi:hypothetical protein
MRAQLISFEVIEIWFFLFEYWGVESILGPLGTAATPGLLYLPRVIVRDGEVGGMSGFGMGNRSARRKPAPKPLCPPQILLAKPGREPGPPPWETSD